MTSNGTIRSLPINRGDITHACVTDSRQHGTGVFSWHDNASDARYNARITGGKCVRVPHVKGELVIPPLATELLGHRLRPTPDRD